MKKSNVISSILCIILIGISFSPLMAATDVKPQQTDTYIEAVPEYLTVDMLSVSEFTITIEVDSDWQSIDTVSTDYLYWTPGMMELIDVEKGNLFSGTTAEVGIYPYTPLPDSSVAKGESKTWNMSLPALISQLGGDKTGIVFHAQDPSGWGAPPWTRYIDYTITVNGVIVEDDTFTATWDAGGLPINTIHYSYLEDWISAGISTSDEYLDITLAVGDGGVDHINVRKTEMFSTDSHKRYLVWGHNAGTFMPGDFMILTFEPLKTGAVQFNMSPAGGAIRIALAGIPYPIIVTNCSFNITAGEPPIISNIFPGNNTENINPIPHISATFTDPDGDPMDIYINVTNADDGPTSDSWFGVGDGARTISAPSRNQIATFGKTYYWEVWVSDGWNPPVTANYSFTLRDQHVVGEPTFFDAELDTKNSIDLDWARGENATHTVIIAKLGSYPVDRTDGAEIYNGTGTYFLHDGLNPEESWYYRAWGWDDVDKVFSATYAQDTATTPANNPIVLSDEAPENGTTVPSSISQLSIMITDPEGGLIDYSIESSSGQSISETDVLSGVKTLSISGLSPGETYTWWVNATDDEGMTTSEWYTFKTLPNLSVVFSSENPTNGSLDEPVSLIWSIVIEDPDGDLFDWSIECSNGQNNVAYGDTNGTKSVSLSGLEYDTEYVVWVNATDVGSGLLVAEWFTFTTVVNLPPLMPLEIPEHNQSGVNPKIGRLRVLVEDPEGHSMDVEFYWGNGTLIGIHAGVASGTIASVIIPQLEEYTEYFWYVNVTDEYGETTRGPTLNNWSFTTGEVPTVSGGMPTPQTQVSFLTLEMSGAGVAAMRYRRIAGASILIYRKAITPAQVDVFVIDGTTQETGLQDFYLTPGTYEAVINARGYKEHTVTFDVTGEPLDIVVYMELETDPEENIAALYFGIILLIISFIFALFTIQDRIDYNHGTSLAIIFAVVATGIGVISFSILLVLGASLIIIELFWLGSHKKIVF